MQRKLPVSQSSPATLPSTNCNRKIHFSQCWILNQNKEKEENVSHWTKVAVALPLYFFFHIYIEEYICLLVYLEIRLTSTQQSKLPVVQPHEFIQKEVWEGRFTI